MFPILRLSIVLATLKLATTTVISIGAQDVSQDRCDARLAQGLPYFLAGVPSNVQEHTYSPMQRRSNHTATGSGLHDATVGQPASFTIHLFPQEGDPPNRSWNIQHGTFIYVWIASKDQILTADVVNNGDGSLTATYESSFPGEYVITVEAITIDNHNEGMPIKGSPFALTIVGDPALDMDALPTCSAEDESVKEAFWRPGTWVSSNIASAKHGVTRDGWVFQPKTCVHDTFSYDELMLLASLNEPTWLLVLGGSIQRGMFLTLADMILAQGQKDDMHSSAIQKCWGYADVTVGNLRVTYQDMRLWRVNTEKDSVQCDNEKLVSGSTSAFLRSARDFLKLTVFKDGQTWPTVIFAPSFVVHDDKSPNTSIEGANWKIANPTRTALNDVGITLNKKILDDGGIERLESYRQRDPRVKFLSAFPMHQAKLFENERTKRGIRQYGGSQHYHYVAHGRDDFETYSGAKMVHSTITEMLSHITIAAAVGTKAAFYKKVAATPDIGRQSAKVRRSFEVCTDCPSGLLPFHVKPVPEPECETLTSLSGGAPTGKVWDDELCPDWCMATDPVDKTPTESGLVDVRVCDPGSLHP